MKTLEITTNKRLLIVERPEGKSTEEALSEYESREKWEFLVFGSDLTKEIAEGLVEASKYMNYAGESGWVDYKVYPDGLIFDAMESFISAIEAAGYHWTNPLADEICAPDIDEWQDAESRTFHPKRVLIFEIVEG